MSFYHVLQSDASSQTFTNNNAAIFSTPIANPYVLQGDWEMAIMNITHGNCVYTFDNDRVTVKRKVKSLQDARGHCFKVELERPKTNDVKHVIDHLILEFKKKLSSVIELRKNRNGYTYLDWFMKDPNVFIILSEALYSKMGLESGVVTGWDDVFQNMTPYKKQFDFTPEDDLSVIVVSLDYKRQEFIIKEEGERVNFNTLLKRYNEIVPSSVAKLVSSDFERIYIEKMNSDGIVVLHSKQLMKDLNHGVAGKFYRGKNPIAHRTFLNDYRGEWKVTLYTIDNVSSLYSTLSDTCTLEPSVFSSYEQMKDFLKAKFKPFEIDFDLNSRDHLQVKIKDEDLSIEFDDTVRDILAFDQNTYTGKGVFSASDTPSFARRIQFLFIYSNVSDSIRIGDTEAPLIGVTPFKPKSCQVLTEKIFKNPMYIPVIQNHISQIDIGIYDDAGMKVPFIEGMTTSLCLHFRQK